MKKLTFYFLFFILVCSCNSTKYVPDGQLLLTKNTIYVDSVKNAEPNTFDYVIQRPNTKALGAPLSLYFYNLGNPNAPKSPKEWGEKNPNTYSFFKNVFSEKQSIGVAKSFININKWVLKNGKKPVIINDIKTKRTLKSLKAYFDTEGYFNAKVTSKKDTISNKKGAISYYVTKGEPLILDTISIQIDSPVLDSLYKVTKDKSYLKSNEQYKNINFINEANRITKFFRNNGIYSFNTNSIGFHQIDTTNANYKTNVDLQISDRVIEYEGDYYKKYYTKQKLKKINVYTDYAFSKKDEIFADSLNLNGINYFAHDKLKFNPKHLSESLFFGKNSMYSDSLRDLTKTHLRKLKNFKTVSIKYNELNDDELEANIFLTPIEKYTLGLDTELSRSNIRDFDVSGKISLIDRNAFRGAEIFKLSLFGSYFNAVKGPGWQIGTDLTLEVPRLIAPFGLNKLVPKRMFPKTQLSTGIIIQRNIGLDKQNINAGINYKWQFNKRKSIQLEIFNTQYIRNLNTRKYFTIYNSELSKLNEIAKVYKNDPSFAFSPNVNDEDNDNAISFLSTVQNDTDFSASNPSEHDANANIFNRYNIISSDFLIPVIAYTLNYNTQEDINDQSFSYFKIRFANSGNIMGLFTKQNSTNDSKTVFKIPLAQYFKTDIEYKKFWKVNTTTTLGFRAFTGVILPYDNSKVPFSRSYFAGGSNDIRAWRTYELGPGRNLPVLEYNIGSLKFLSSLEYRFDIIGNLKSALFIDTGNIWSINNDFDPEGEFNGLASFKDLAVGSGFGLRYDFKFLIGRLDLGFKTHEPYLTDNKWFRNFNFSKATYNIGINYPF